MSWRCPSCDYPNPDNRKDCFKCGILKPAPVDNRRIDQLTPAEARQLLDEYKQSSVLSSDEIECWKTGKLGSFWDEDMSYTLHNDPVQRNRQICSQTFTSDQIIIDTVQMSACIEDCNATLQNCTCSDYLTRGLPCDHMYALAQILGVFTPEDDLYDD